MPVFYDSPTAALMLGILITLGLVAEIIQRWDLHDGQ